jgi:hypothetical protein
MWRIQLYMDELMDDRLEAEAAERGVSKASLIREAVAAHCGAPARRALHAVRTLEEDRCLPMTSR